MLPRTLLRLPFLDRPRRRELVLARSHRQAYLVRPVGQRLRSRLERLLAALTPPAPPDWCPAWTIPEDFYALGWP